MTQEFDAKFDGNRRMRAAHDVTAIASLADEIQRTFEHGSSQALENVGSRSLTLACQHLLETNRLAAAEHAIRRLHAALPSLRYAETLTRVFDCKPVGPAPLLEFAEDRELDVQVVRRPNCDAALVVFCGMSNRAGLPVAVVHRWLGRLPVSIIYLRDFREIAGGVGFPSLGPDRATSVEGLKQLTSDIGARRIYTYGNSAGAFPALHYGLNVGARAVLCMAGPTTLTREFNEDMPTFGKTLSRGPAEVPEYAVDMRPLYAAAENPPKVLFVYGTGFPRDRRWAENMGGLPSVQLVPIEGLAEHNVVVPSITSGIFPGLLSRFIALGED